MPARQSARSVLTPRSARAAQPLTPRAAASPREEPSEVESKPALDRPADADAEPPARERRRSGVKVVPSRYLDTSNVTARSASRPRR
jgi:hypothetical protein